MNQINDHPPPGICATARMNCEVMATDGTDFTEGKMLNHQETKKPKNTTNEQNQRAVFHVFQPISQLQGFDFSPVTTKHPKLIKSARRVIQNASAKSRVLAHGQQACTHIQMRSADFGFRIAEWGGSVGLDTIEHNKGG